MIRILLFAMKNSVHILVVVEKCFDAFQLEYNSLEEMEMCAPCVLRTEIEYVIKLVVFSIAVIAIIFYCLTNKR